jgi:putative hydrolase of the HAD superfamily
MRFLAKLLTIKKKPSGEARKKRLMSKIKGVIFDFGDVISQPQDDSCLTEMIRLLGVADKADFITVYRSYRRDYDGGGSGTDYWFAIMNHYGMKNDAAICAALIEQDTLSWFRVKPEMIVLIESLKAQGLRLALLSNMPLEIRNYLQEKADWLGLFDHKVFSCDLKLLKPDAAIYRHCLDRLGLKAEECLFIDDVPENVAAARSRGIAAIRFQSFAQMKEEITEMLG